ncbi:HIRA-interacting protein 3, partial [Girardinichthys multiradiatus]|uniref:HIRA-interacting protein 3 n=1 Tax=Girardinichthys multiradiatus TaxID=208333 RepID=UPI001FAD4FFA
WRQSITLTLGILKKRYLGHAGCESLNSEARKFMKQVVEEELAKMQKNDDGGSEPETKKPQKKRKREKEELESEDETESTAKKTCSQQSGSSSDSEDEQNCKTGSQSKEQNRSQSENEEAEEEESDNEKSKKPERCVTDDDLSDEMNGSEESRNESPSPEERMKKKTSTTKNREIRSGGEKKPRSDEESESDADSKSGKSDKISDGVSSASEKVEENVKKRKDSDSSSLCSLEEEKKGSAEKTKDARGKKAKKKDEKNQGPKDEDKAVVRLKRYIALCGVRRNYKKLLDGCRSTRSKVAVLKKELEDLGVHGNPSIEKCKKIRLKREEAQELAELDVDNIITTEGRPKRRGTSAMQVHLDPPSSYQCTLNSDSDSDQENDAHKKCRKMSEWANLHGIISDDADTD